MTNYLKAIEVYVGREVDFHPVSGEVLLQNDGAGVYIARWDIISPTEPTLAYLDTLWSDLDDAKVVKKTAIDAKTEQLIYNGFTYDSKEFSLSDHSQSNWNSLYTRLNAGKILPGEWPLNVPTKNDEAYGIADAATLEAMYQAGYDVKYGYVASGLTLKVQVDACADIAAVNAIVDDRT